MEDILDFELDLLQEEQKIDLSKMRFPSVLIEGASMEIELEMLYKNKVDDSTSLPLFVLFGNEAIEVGKFDMNSDSLLDYKLIGNYKLTLYKSPEVKVNLDYRDVNLLLNLIKL